MHWKLSNYILRHKVMLCYTTMDIFKDVFFAATIYFRPALNRFLNSKERYWSGNTLELVFSVGSALGDCNSQAVSWRVGGLLVIQVFQLAHVLKSAEMCTHHKRKKWFYKIFTLRYEGWNLTIPASLFSFSENGPKQNAWSFLTPVSDTDFYALLCDMEAAFCLHFSLHGSSNNRIFQRFWLVVEELGPIAKRLKS